MIWEEIGRDRTSSVKCAHGYKHCLCNEPTDKCTGKNANAPYEMLLPFRYPVFLPKDGWWNVRLMVAEIGQEPVGCLTNVSDEANPLS